MGSDLLQSEEYNITIKGLAKSIYGVQGILCYLHESKQRIKGHVVSSRYSNEKFMMNLENTNLNILKLTCKIYYQSRNITISTIHPNLNKCKLTHQFFQLGKNMSTLPSFMLQELQEIFELLEPNTKRLTKAITKETNVDAKVKANSDECKVQKIMQTITRESIKKIKRKEKLNECGIEEINNLEKDGHCKFQHVANCNVRFTPITYTTTNQNLEWHKFIDLFHLIDITW